MSIVQQAIQEMIDYEIGLVTSYIAGTNKRCSRGTRYDELNARSSMESLIRRTCHIRVSGIEVGGLDFGMYRREKKRRELRRAE